MRSPPSLRESRVYARRIFDHQCKKTFATKSANCGLMHCSKTASLDHLVSACNGHRRHFQGRVPPTESGVPLNCPANSLLKVMEIVQTTIVIPAESATH